MVRLLLVGDPFPPPPPPPRGPGSWDRQRFRRGDPAATRSRSTEGGYITFLQMHTPGQDRGWSLPWGTPPCSLLADQHPPLTKFKESRTEGNSDGWCC